MDQLFKKVLLRTLGFLLVLSLSPWLFVLVEYTEQNDVEEKHKLLKSVYESMASKYNMSIADFNNFSSMAYEALSEPKLQWTYATSLRFVFQAVTTIGYGFITPQTPEGQLLCIFVSLLGIPITMLAFKSIGEIIAKWISNVVEKFETKIFKRTRPKRMQAKSTVFLVSLMVLIIMVNGSLMMRVFSWSLMEGVYFWFITLTTIGFGDYVPAKSQRIMKLSINISHDNEEKSAAGATEKITIIFTGIFYTFYVVLCLCFVSSVLNSVVATMEESKCRTLCSGCVPRKTHDNQHNDQNNTSEQCDMTYLGMENFGFTRRENSTPLPTKGLKTIPLSTPANLESQQAKDF